MKRETLTPVPRKGNVLALYKRPLPGREVRHGLFRVDRVTPSGQVVLAGRDYRFDAGGVEIGGGSDKLRIRWPTDEDRADYRRANLERELRQLDWTKQTTEVIEGITKLLGIEPREP